MQIHIHLGVFHELLNHFWICVVNTYVFLYTLLYWLDNVSSASFAGSFLLRKLRKKKPKLNVLLLYLVSCPCFETKEILLQVLVGPRWVLMSDISWKVEEMILVKLKMLHIRKCFICS